MRLPRTKSLRLIGFGIVTQLTPHSSATAIHPCVRAACFNAIEPLKPDKTVNHVGRLETDCSAAKRSLAR